MSFSASKAEYVLYVFLDSLGTETLEDIKGKISKSSFNMIGIPLYQVVLVNLWQQWNKVIVCGGSVVCRLNNLGLWTSEWS